MAPTFSPLAFARRHTSTMSALSPWIVIAGAGFDLAIGSSPVLWEIRNEWSVATKTRLGLGSSELVSSRMALDPLAIRRSFYVFVRRSPARRLDQSQVTSKKCEANYRTTYPSSFAAEDWRGRSAPCTGFLPAATRDYRFDAYRPKLYYMRGLGPNWHAKHFASSPQFRADLRDSFVRQTKKRPQPLLTGESRHVLFVETTQLNWKV